MEIKEGKDLDILDEFLANNSLVGSEFLISPRFLTIDRDNKYHNPFFLLDDQQSILAVFAISERKTIFGWKYAYLPRGPIWKKGISSLEIGRGLAAIHNFLEKSGFIFWRFEPSLLPGPGSFSQEILPVQPKKTIAVSLDMSLEDIAASFHQKTRYNIRLAEKKGVSVGIGRSEEDFSCFWRLMEETKDRDGFRIHGQDHYRRLFFAGDDFIVPLFAQYEGKVIAAGIFCFFGNRATYLHGASSNSDRQVMAPYLLQWEGIRLAKERGCRVYDFYGIDEERWPGVTRFKRGFAGQEIEYPGTFEQGIKRINYFIFLALKKIRKII